MINSTVTRLYEAVSWLAYEKAVRAPIASYERLITALFRKQHNAVIKALRKKRTLFTEANIIDQIDVDLLFDTATATINEAALAPIDKATEAVLLQGAQAAIREYTLGISFKVTHPRAVEYLKDHGSLLITQVNDTTKQTINRIIIEGLARGDSYTSIEKAIIKEYRSFSVAPKFGNSDIRTRAQLVAINEVGNAYQTGNYAAVAAAQDTGLQFEKAWITVGDRRVSAGCVDNAAQGYIPLDTDHASGHAHPCRFPGCRCFEAYRRAK